MYANVPAEVIMNVVCKHCGLRSDSVQLPALVVPEATAAEATAGEKESETDEERDENGCKWAAAAVPPTTDESSVMSDDRHSPCSMDHMGAPPPPPPPLPINLPLAMGSPISPTRFLETMATMMPPMPGEMTPPQQLRQVEMSPIEKKEENQYKFEC